MQVWQVAATLLQLRQHLLLMPKYHSDKSASLLHEAVGPSLKRPQLQASCLVHGVLLHHLTSDPAQAS